MFLSSEVPVVSFLPAATQEAYEEHLPYCCNLKDNINTFKMIRRSTTFPSINSSYPNSTKNHPKGLQNLIIKQRVVHSFTIFLHIQHQSIPMIQHFNRLLSKVRIFPNAVVHLKKGENLERRLTPPNVSPREVVIILISDQ